MYVMQVITRDFLRRFSHYKRHAVAGKVVKVVDRDGRQFVFQAERPAHHSGAGRHLAKGRPLSPEPVPVEEWKGNY
jgi:hypothetical protein